MYVILTVTLGWVASGNNRTCNPFASWYSVIPSMEVTFLTPAGSDCAGAATEYTRRVRRASSCLQRILFTLDDSTSLRFRSSYSNDDASAVRRTDMPRLASHLRGDAADPAIPLAPALR